MDYLTVAELADLKDCSERYIRKLILCNEIKAEEITGSVGRGGISYQIPLANLDPRLQKKYIRLKAKEQAEMEVPEADFDSKVIPFNLEELSDAEREQVAFWKKLLQDWQTYRQSAKSKTEADSQYLQMLDLRYGLKITARSLERKWKKWQEEGDAALVDNRGKHGKHHRALSKEAYEIFEYYYLDESRKTVAECMRLTNLEMKKVLPEQLPLPSTDTFIRAIKERTPVPVIQYYRFGQKAYKDKCAPYINRTYTDLYSNDVWVTDNHTFDVMVNKEGKNVRVYLTAFLDVRSRKMMGWYVTDAPRSQATLYALKRGIMKYGIPKMIYSDNGREFLTHDIGGKGFRERKAYRESEEHRPPTILELLGIEFRTALVRNAKAKIIERAFRTVKEEFSRLYEGYTGGHIKERPERLKALAKNPDNFTILEDFTEFVDHWLAGVYNKQVHSGKGMAGRSPDEVWEKYLMEQRVAKPEELNLMMLRNSNMQKVKRNGVLLTFYEQELWYRNDDICLQHFDEKVYVRYDPDDLNTVRVYNEQDRFIGEAALETPLSYFASQEEIKSHMQETRKLERTVRAYKKEKGIEATDALELTLQQAMENLETEETFNPKVVSLHRFVDNVLAEGEENLLGQAVGNEAVIDWGKANERLEKLKEE